MLRKYNPKKITGSFSGKIGTREFAVQFIGYMDGTFMEAEYDEAQVTKHSGAHGDYTAVLNPNKGATCTVTFIQGSPVNDDLSNLVPDADLDFFPVGVLSFVDLNGTTAVKSPQAWIQKTAKVEFGKDVSGRAWTFDLTAADIHVGGSAEVA